MNYAFERTREYVNRAPGTPPITLSLQAPAIVHCRPRTAIAFSLSHDGIVPVIWEEFASGSPEMANHLADTLAKYKIVMMRGHVSFAIGQTLDEAFHWSSTLEESCEIALKRNSSTSRSSNIAA